MFMKRFANKMERKVGNASLNFLNHRSFGVFRFFFGTKKHQKALEKTSSAASPGCFDGSGREADELGLEVPHTEAQQRQGWQVDLADFEMTRRCF